MSTLYSGNRFDSDVPRPAPLSQTERECCEKCTDIHFPNREYVCDRSCPCHTQRSDWRERFYEQINEIIRAAIKGKRLVELVKELETLFESERENVRRDCAKDLEAKKLFVTDCSHTPNDSCDSDCVSREFNIGYNAALEDALNCLKNNGTRREN